MRSEPVSRDPPSRSERHVVLIVRPPTLTYRYLADKYKIDMSSNANVTNFNNAIKRAAEKGDLSLPKGLSGRVKLGAKVRDADSTSIPRR